LEEFGFNLEQAESIYTNLREQSGNQFLSTGYRLVIDRDVLIIQPIEKETSPDSTLIEGEGKFVLSNFQIECRITHEQFNTSSHEAWLDYSKLKFPLLWRKWKEGDRFIPLGMKSFKKVSDFLIDEKVSIPEKERITVIESGGEIVWVVGKRIDERMKLENASETEKTFTIKKLK
jgi:tRNA(Ile)-lysidine synthase